MDLLRGDLGMSRDNPTIVALIPARSGSKRVPHKNIRPLAGHPLIAYSISAAVNSGVTGATARVAFGMVEEEKAEDCGDVCSPSPQ